MINIEINSFAAGDGSTSAGLRTAVHRGQAILEERHQVLECEIINSGEWPKVLR
jgi:hypothetical protein